MRGKRIFDLAFAVPGLLLLTPLLLFLAAWVRLDSPGPALFRQTRVGRNGRLFIMFKLRTMFVDPDAGGRQLTVGDDVRITRAGAVLRRLKLDELPQLLNVVRGDMSLVGPRPEVPRYVSLYTDEQRRVLDLLPGITDPASMLFRHESELLAALAEPEAFYIAHILPRKIAMNLEYADRASLRDDFMIILKTLFGRKIDIKGFSVQEENGPGANNK